MAALKADGAVKWSAVKSQALHWLMAWLAGQLWAFAQDAVELLAQRNDLSGQAKLALARELLKDRVREAGHALSTSMANFLLEAAVQLRQGSA